MSRPTEVLFDWVAVGRPDDEVAAHAARCAACRAEADALEADLSGLGLALAPVEPSARALGRLLDAVWQLHAPAVAAHFDLDLARATELLRRADDEASWVPGKHGTRLLHFAGGPALAGADCGFARLPVGGGLPEHRHPGDERVLVLQGRLVEAGGRAWGPGDVGVFPAGALHSFRVGGDVELILGVVKVAGS